MRIQGLLLARLLVGVLTSPALGLDGWQTEVPRRAATSQTAMKLLGAQWFYAFKLYVAEAGMVNAQDIDTYGRDIAEYVRHYREGIQWLILGNASAVGDAVRAADEVRARIQSPTLAGVLGHFHGLLAALVVESTTDQGSSPAAAKAILKETRGSLVTPEWHHFYALLEYQSGNRAGFEEHLSLARRLASERREVVKSWVRHRLELEVDITTSILELCLRAEQLAQAMEAEHTS